MEEVISIKVKLGYEKRLKDNIKIIRKLGFL